MSTDCVPCSSPALLAATADGDGVGPCAPPACAPGGVSMGAPPPAISSIEFTQAIQRVGTDRRDRQVPLIAGKELIVRVFLSSDAADWPGGALPDHVSAEVATDAGAALPGVYAGDAIAPGGVRADRGDSASSINMVIPDALCRGRLALVLTLIDDDTGNDVASQAFTVAFLTVPELPVDLVPLELDLDDTAAKTTKNFSAPQLPEPWGPLADVAPFFPTPGFQVRTFQKPRKIASEKQRGFADARSDLAKSHLASTSEGIVVGVVTSSVKAEKVPVLGRSQTGVCLLIDGSPLLVAHEMGHILGRRHTPGSNQTGMDPDYPERWPDIEGTIEEVGFAIAPADPAAPQGPVTFRTFSPPRTFDYMGGPDDTEFWTSAYGYERVLASMRRCGWRRRGVPRCDLLLDVEVMGAEEIRLGPSYRITTRPDPPLGPDTLFTAEQLDDRGGVLRRSTLHAADCGTGGDVGLLPRFVEAIPWHPLTRALSISHDGTQIGRVDVGTAPAVTNVTLDPPTGSRVVELSWDLDDEDGVFHLIRYTPDGGGTWYPVAVDHEGTMITIDLSGYPTGPECRFEITASRDIGTTTVRSPAFELDPLAPTIGIDSPVDGASFSEGDVIALSGWAFSPDAPDVPDESFLWTAEDANGIHQLGAGRRILVDQGEWQAGTVSITLRVGTQEATIEIEAEGSGGG